MSRVRLAALVAAVAVAAPSLVATAACRRRAPKVVLAFLPVEETPPKDPTIAAADDPRHRSTRATSCHWGSWARRRAATSRSRRCSTWARARAPRLSAYDTKKPTSLDFHADFDAEGNATLLGWPRRPQACRQRVRRDPSRACSDRRVPGGIGYAGVARPPPGGGDRRRRRARAPSTSRRSGRRATSRGAAATLLAKHDVVVVGLPTGEAGARQMDRLIRRHRPGELLIVMQTPPRLPRAAAAADRRHRPR